MLNKRFVPVCFALTLILVTPVVNAQATFTVIVMPNQLVLGTETNSSDRFSVTVLAGQGFNGTVTLQVSGIPNGVNTSFENPIAYVTPLIVSSTYLTVTSSSNATLGSYLLTISGSSEQGSTFYVASNQVTLIIQQNGQPKIPLAGNETQSVIVAESYVVALVIVGVVAGLALGIAVTYIFMRERTGAAHRRH